MTPASPHVQSDDTPRGSRATRETRTSRHATASETYKLSSRELWLHREDQVTHPAVLVEDDTKGKELERWLSEHESWFATTLHAVSDAVVTMDLAGTVTFVNTAAERLTGSTGAEAIGRPVGEVVRLVDKHRVGIASPLVQALAGARAVTLAEVYLVNLATGANCPVSTHVVPVGESGRTIGAVMVMREVANPSSLQLDLDQLDRQLEIAAVSDDRFDATTRIGKIVVDLKTFLHPIATLVVAVAPQPARPRGRILAIDDDPLVLRAIQRFLSAHDLVCVDNGADALALLDQGERFDLILTDLAMPGMTGSAFLEQVAKRCHARAESVVFVTGGALTATSEAFLQATPNRCIEKPFTSSALQALLDQRLSGS